MNFEKSLVSLALAARLSKCRRFFFYRVSVPIETSARRQFRNGSFPRENRPLRREESFQVGAKEPRGTDPHRTISKNSSGCRFLIGHKKCFVLLCPIGEHSSWVLFVCSYTMAIVWITACLAHSLKKRTQSGNFQFDIKSPSKDAFPKKTSFSLQQVFTLASATACVNIYREFLKDTTTADSHENVAWKNEFINFSVSVVIIPTSLLCQM